jgi:hypothetical protein
MIAGIRSFASTRCNERLPVLHEEFESPRYLDQPAILDSHKLRYVLSRQPLGPEPIAVGIKCLFRDLRSWLFWLRPGEMPYEKTGVTEEDLERWQNEHELTLFVCATLFFLDRPFPGLVGLFRSIPIRALAGIVVRLLFAHGGAFRAGCGYDLSIPCRCF